MPRAAKVLLLEPFDGGSHRAFAHGWAARSAHRIEIAALPPRFWKWRLRGAAYAFAERLAGTIDRYDAVVATSLMNAAEFAALTRLRAPLIVYFHENQLSYPRPPGEPLDHGLALASLASAAAADRVVFNSRFHRDVFLRGLDAWTARFPEYAPRAQARAIARKASVIPPGIDWDALAPLAGRAARAGEKASPPRSASRGSRARVSLVPRTRTRLASGAARDGGGSPLILWNHRWEFDKNAPAFFWALDQVAGRGRAFRVALLGESSQFVPTPFLEARSRLADRVVRYGYVRSRDAYVGWLGRADIIVSTAHQENFGLSVVEAIAAGAHPLLPARLSYPEVLPKRFHAASLYRSQNDLVRKLDRLLVEPEKLAANRFARSRAMRRYDWARITPRLDALVDSTDW